MQWSLGGIVSYLKGIIRPGGSFSTDEDSYFKDLINSTIDGVCLSFPIRELRVPNYFIQTVADYSTGTATATTGSKTVTLAGSTLTYDMKGRKIQLNSEDDYYIIKDLNTATSVITLDRGWLGTTASSLTILIFENSYALPKDFNWGKGVFIFDTRWQPLENQDWDWIEARDPSFTDTGTPDIFAIEGQREIREPYTGTNTADATTSTTALVDSSLIATADDYYKDWYLVNTTTGGTSRITGYTVSTTTIQLEEAITGQAVGDSYFLLSQAVYMALYPRYTATSNVKVKYYSKHPLLVNDYDIPKIPSDFRNYITAAVLEIWYGKDGLAIRYANMKVKEEINLQAKYSKELKSFPREGARQILGRQFTFKVGS